MTPANKGEKQSKAGEEKMGVRTKFGKVGCEEDEGAALSESFGYGYGYG